MKSGEVLPVDGLMLDAGVLDESALSGESRPVDRPSGDRVRSGALNSGTGPAPRGHRDGRGEHLRRHRPARDRGAGDEGAGGPGRRPVRHDLHPCDVADRRRGVGVVGRSHPRAFGPRGGDPVPA